MKQSFYNASTMERKAESSSAAWAELLAAAGLVVWRMAAGPARGYWKDWMLLLGVFWIYTSLRRRAAAWPVVTVTLMAYLLGIYLLGQLPHALAVLGIGL